MKFEYYGWDDGTSLYHFGIQGQKWGVRRFQNPDGTLTEEGKKRYQKKYNKIIQKSAKKVNANYNTRYVNAYNMAARDMNNGGIEKFNRDWKRKHGNDLGEAYENAYMNQFSDLVARYLDKLTRDEVVNDSNYIKAEKLADEIERKYGKGSIKRERID